MMCILMGVVLGLLLLALGFSIWLFYDDYKAQKQIDALLEKIMADPRWVVGKNLARLEGGGKEMACSTKKPVKKTAKKVAKKVKK